MQEILELTFGCGFGCHLYWTCFSSSPSYHKMKTWFLKNSVNISKPLSSLFPDYSIFWRKNIAFTYRQFLVVACLGYNNTTPRELLEVLFVTAEMWRVLMLYALSHIYITSSHKVGSVIFLCICTVSEFGGSQWYYNALFYK